MLNFTLLVEIDTISVPLPFKSHLPQNGWDSSLLSTSCYQAKQKCSFCLLLHHNSSSLLGLHKFNTKMFITLEEKTATLMITCSKQSVSFCTII